MLEFQRDRVPVLPLELLKNSKLGGTVMIVAGIDVSKESLDCFCSGGREIRRFRNNGQGRLKLLTYLQRNKVTLVVLEATGGYEEAFCRLIWGAEMPVAKVNPRWVRAFAQSQGKRAKNDHIDARNLMEYGERNNPATTPPVPEVIQELRGYLTRRKQLNDMLVMEKNHMAAPEVSPIMKKSVQKLLLVIKQEIKELDHRISQAIDGSPEIKSKAEKLRAQTGVGPVLMTTLIADVPELGRVPRNVASALLGVAPFDDDSGKHSGKRRIAGGRVRPRNALYMATLAAIRHDEHLKAFYRRLVSRGKPRKIALVACMRKFIVYLNGILKNDPSQHFMAA